MSSSGIIGGAVGAVVVGLALWTLSAPSPCERVYRGTAPIRVAGDGVRWVGEHWLDQGSRLQTLVWSLEFNEFSQKIVTRQFYGEEIQCMNGLQLRPAANVPGVTDIPSPQDKKKAQEKPHA